jgi:hypothetical protein
VGLHLPYKSSGVIPVEVEAGENPPASRRYRSSLCPNGVDADWDGLALEVIRPKDPQTPIDDWVAIPSSGGGLEVDLEVNIIRLVDYGGLDSGIWCVAAGIHLEDHEILNLPAIPQHFVDVRMLSACVPHLEPEMKDEDFPAPHYVYVILLESTFELADIDYGVPLPVLPDPPDQQRYADAECGSDCEKNPLL